MLRINCKNYEDSYKKHFEIVLQENFDKNKIKLDSLRDNFDTIMDGLLNKNFRDPSNDVLYNFAEEYINLCLFAASSLNYDDLSDTEIVDLQVKSINDIKNIKMVINISNCKAEQDYYELFKDKTAYEKFKNDIIDNLKYINGSLCEGNQKYRILFDDEIRIKVDGSKKTSAFNYGCLKSSIKSEYLKEIGIETCPYCNHSFIQTFYGRGYCNTFDLDHFYPKSIFPLLMLSLYNFVPSCKTCNQLFKNDDDSVKKMVNPNVEAFGDDAVFEVLDNMDGTFKVKLKIVNSESEKGQRCKKNSEIFHLEKLYEGRQNYINDVIYKKRNYTKDVIDEIKKVLASNRIPCTDEMINKMIYGFNLDEKEDGLYVLSKFTRDIINSYDEK